MATREQLEAELIRLEASYRYYLALERALDSSPNKNGTGYPTSGPRYQELLQITQKLGELITRIAEVKAELLALPTTPAGPASAGAIAQNDDQATVSNASTQRPQSPPQILENGRVKPPPDTTSGSNAQVSPTPDAQDFGTDGQLRPGIITQGTPGQVQNANPGSQQPNVNASGQPNAPVPGNLPGASAGSEDAARPNTTQQEVDVTFSDQKIVSQDNILDQYGTYTYVASVYLMTLAAANAMVNTKQKSLNGSQLLFQSGGAPVGGRNQFFTNDYYIENIQLNSVITGKGSGWSHNVQTIRMTVVEPNGITLLDNLNKAVNSYLGTANKGVDANQEINYQSELYLLVIRFYGYDDAGNLVRGGVAKPDGSSDPNAFVEKWYPMRINNIKFKVGTKLVQYDIEATSAQFDLNSGSARGTIPYNLELSGKTVKDVLTGPTNYQANIAGPAEVLGGGALILDRPAPEKVSAAPSKDLTIKQGLFTAMNDYQAKLVQQGYQNVADVYEIVFDSPAIANAQIKRGPVGSTDKSSTAMARPNTAADTVDPKKSSMAPNTRNEAITAGQQVVTIIDQIIRNSSFIQDQQLYVVDETTGELKPNGKGAKNLSWFKISFSAAPIAYDAKRNDYGYRMRFNVSLYKINNAPPPWFPQPQFNGVHKQYNYWFTGLNTQVLEYEQNYNSQYALVMSGGLTKELAQQTSNRNVLQKFNFSPRSGESSFGAKGRTNEAAANLADYLYNPGDLGRVDMRIVGDPAWLQQGEAFAGLNVTDPNRFAPFLRDGTINFDSQEILFEVLFNTPVDYDLNNGLIDPGQNNFNANRTRGQAGNARQSYIYQATEVTSDFDRGKFTQRLKGVLRQFDTPTQQAAAQGATDQRTQGLANNSVQRNGTLSPVVLGPTLSTPIWSVNPVNSNGTGGLLSTTVQKVLGRSPTGPFTPPYVPTSSGQPVGTVNTPTIDPTTGQPISANERVVGTDATPDINTQIGAAGDDAYDPGNYSSSEESLNQDFGGATIQEP